FSDDASTPMASVALIGLGTTGIFHISMNPLQFGSVKVGKSDTVSVTVKNIGNGQLSLNSQLAITNSVFALSHIIPSHQPPYLLNPGDTIGATFTYTPSDAVRDTGTFFFTV